MSEIIIIIVLVGLFACAFTCALYVAISMALKTSKEKGLYSAMISNPCDKTVLNYINAFNATYGIGSNWYNTNSSVAHRNSQLRQGQGWEIIKNSSSVSPGVKEQLRNALVSKGVPIKDMSVK